MSRPNLLDRRLARFLREPPSVRAAASVIVTATLVIVVGAGALIRLIDSSEYDNVWVGMWWALQTVTTVGYGDVTPKNVTGRLVGAFVMLQGVAFIAIVTAAITSTFVARATRQFVEAQDEGEVNEQELLARRLDDLELKLDRIAALLGDDRAPS